MAKSPTQNPAASPELAAALAATHARAFTQSRPWSAQEIAALCHDRFTQLWGDPQCFAITRSIAGEAELLTIATNPDHRRQGLAKHLMASWLAAAEVEGISEAYLEVAADNQAANALYCSCGFVLAGRRKAYYPRPSGPAVDAVLMKREFP